MEISRYCLKGTASPKCSIKVFNGQLKQGKRGVLLSRLKTREEVNRKSKDKKTRRHELMELMGIDTISKRQEHNRLPHSNKSRTLSLSSILLLRRRPQLINRKEARAAESSQSACRRRGGTRKREKKGRRN